MTEPVLPGEDTERRVIMGRVLGPYGVKGWIKIQPHTEDVGALANFSHWWLLRDARWTALRVEETDVHDAHIVARLAGCESRDEAFLFRGAEVAVERSELPNTQPGEYYQADLIGMMLRNREGVELGRLNEFFDNGAHDVMRVQSPGGERLIPFIPSVVDSVDVEAREINIDWGANW